MARNVKAGYNCGRIAYKIIHSGQAAKQYEQDIFVTKLCGGEVGELNHSVQFLAKIRPEFAREVKFRCKTFLTSFLDQTGHRPPGSLTADVGTYKHRSRQFTAFNCFNPGSVSLIEAISISQDVLRTGKTGPQL